MVELIDAPLQSGGPAVDAPVLLGRQQQGQQSVARVAPLGSVQAPRLPISMMFLVVLSPAAELICPGLFTSRCQFVLSFLSQGGDM